MTDLRRKLREMYSVNYSASAALGGVFTLIGGLGTYASLHATAWPDGAYRMFVVMLLSGLGAIALGIHQHKLHQKTTYRYKWMSHDEL